MLYVERDQYGKVAGIFQSPTSKASEEKSLMDEEVLDFLRRTEDTDSWVQLLSMSDVSIIRVLEDLIDLLVKKKVIMLTELPDEAREKISERKRVRQRMEEDQLMVDNIV